jgi:retron-type reverse transcriptase
MSKIILVRGQEPNIEFLVEWKDKSKDKNTWVLERDLKKCPDQTNTESIISAFKANIKLRMGSRQTGGLNYLNIMIICLFSLP